MGPDQEGLTKSKIEAREFWMVHANDKTKGQSPFPKGKGLNREV